jgi:hypothetical protein
MLGFINKLGPGFIILIAFLCFGAATILQLVVSVFSARLRWLK